MACNGPSRPSSRMVLSAGTMARNRCWWTTARGTPAWAQTSTACRARATVTSSGFSTITALPAAAEAEIISRWVFGGVNISATSTPGSARASPSAADTLAPGARTEAAAARFPSPVTTQRKVASSISVSARRCGPDAMPAPIAAMPSGDPAFAFMPPPPHETGHPGALARAPARSVRHSRRPGRRA